MKPPKVDFRTKYSRDKYDELVQIFTHAANCVAEEAAIKNEAREFIGARMMLNGKLSLDDETEVPPSLALTILGEIVRDFSESLIRRNKAKDIIHRWGKSRVRHQRTHQLVVHRQFSGKSEIVARVCAELDKVRTIVGQIGHTDRHVSPEDKSVIGSYFLCHQGRCGSSLVRFVRGTRDLPAKRSNSTAASWLKSTLKNSTGC